MINKIYALLLQFPHASMRQLNEMLIQVKRAQNTRNIQNNEQ